METTKANTPKPTTDVDKIFGRIDDLQNIAIIIRDKAVPLNRGNEDKVKEEATPDPDTGQQIIDRLADVYSILVDAREALNRFA